MPGKATVRFPRYSSSPRRREYKRRVLPKLRIRLLLRNAEMSILMLITRAAAENAKSIRSTIGRNLAKLGRASNDSAATGVSMFSAITTRSRKHLNSANNNPITKSTITSKNKENAPVSGGWGFPDASLHPANTKIAKKATKIRAVPTLRFAQKLLCKLVWSWFMIENRALYALFRYIH
jgi:hypothetical protein